MSGRPAGCVIGVDVGGTKTHWRAVATPAGTVLADEVVPSDLGPGPAETADWLAGVLRAAPVPYGAVGVGAHGCDSQTACRRLEAALTERLGVPVRAVNDAHLLPPAAGRPGAIGVIAGTGSVAAGTGPDGEPMLVGGWGWALGDEGGAAGLVREAARAVCLRHDRGLPPDPLGAALLEAFGAEEVGVLSQQMSRDPGAEAWGRRAPAVFRAAEVGSAVAGQVIEDGGRALAGLVGTLLARGASADGVVAAGGVVTRQTRLFAAFDGAVRERHPGLRVTLLETAPVEGAVRLALELVASGDPVVRGVSRRVPASGPPPAPGSA